MYPEPPPPKSPPDKLHWLISADTDIYSLPPPPTASILMEQLEEPHTVMVVVEVEVILMEVLSAPFT